jgi:hypothetical protein
VEGPSDAAVFIWLMQLIAAEDVGVAVRPVRATGDFESAEVDQAIAIYRSLSHVDALIPPALAFIFDREQRSEKSIQDAEKRKDATVRFLKRRMLENYFLDPRSIANVLSELTPPLTIPPTVDAV